MAQQPDAERPVARDQALGAPPKRADLEPTLDAGPSSETGNSTAARSDAASSRFKSRSGPAVRRQLVEGSGPRLSAVLQNVLQQRLRAASIILAVGFGLYLLRALFVTYHSAVVVYQIVLTAALVASALALSLKRRFGSRTLRLLESALFGAVAVFFGVAEYFAIRAAVESDDGVMLVAGVKSGLMYVFALIVLYGMLIPNRWQRALRIVLPIAAIPPLVALLASWSIPGFIALADRTATGYMASDNLLMLLMAVITAVFGTHVINRLREEAFAARQLGQYRLTRPLGQGGMGEVYLAEHELLKRPCAVKVIRPGKVSDRRVLERFAHEVRSTARLSHWNSIEIFDYGRTDDGTFFYVMEYLPGKNLEELVDESGPLPPGRVIHFLSQVCDALREAHEMGLIHRDIKPSNVFAAHRGGQHDVAKLLDFGLVKDVQPQADPNLTHEGDITGSPLYIAPEVASGESFDGRADIYSLGALAYYLLTGEPPFTGKNAMRVIMAHVRDPVPLPSQKQPGLATDLEQVVLRCLTKSPADRYPDAPALRAALDDCADSGTWTAEHARHWWREFESRA